jgi:hypothetical protein
MKSQTATDNEAKQQKLAVKKKIKKKKQKKNPRKGQTVLCQDLPMKEPQITIKLRDH